MTRSKRRQSRPRSAQTGTLMLRLYGDERAQLDAIRDHLNGLGVFLAPVTNSGAVRWALLTLAREIAQKRPGEQA